MNDLAVIKADIKEAIRRNNATNLDAILCSTPLLCPPNHWWSEHDHTHTWLTKAVERYHEECIAVLMHHGADPFFQCTNNQNKNAIDIAWRFKTREYQTQFLLSLLCVRREEKPPEKRLNPDFLNYIGEDVNVPLKANIFDWDGTGLGDTTALHYAVNHHLPFCVDWLLERGANVNIRDKEGHTPLYCLIEKFEFYHENYLEDDDETPLIVWQGIAYTLIHHGAEIEWDAYSAFPKARQFILENGLLTRQ